MRRPSDQEFRTCTTRELSERYNANERTIRRWKAQAGLSSPVPGPSAKMDAVESAGPAGWQQGVELEGDKGWLCTGPTDKPVTDWARVMELWNLDSSQFEVVGDVTFKAWNGFIKNAADEIETIRLFSYKARIKRISAAEPSVDWAGWRKTLQKLGARTYPTHSGEHERAYVVLVADPQIGKKGTQDALDNWRRGIEYHANRISDLKDRHDVTVLLAFMGDEHEQVTGHYANQVHTVEMNLHDQLITDFDMRVWTIREMCKLGLDKVVSVISNHGELNRVGHDQITGRSDNTSTMITRMTQRLFEEQAIEWHIAEGNPTVHLDLAGAKLAFSHGHVAKGTGKGEMRVRTAIERQILGDPLGAGAVDVHFTAHYHHFHCVEDRGRTIFGCPALEAEKSSEYMLDQFGIWSRPGMLGIQIGSAYGARKWSAPEVSW